MTWRIEDLPDGRRIAVEPSGEKMATIEHGELRICWMEDGRELDGTDAPRIPTDVLRRML